MPNLKADHNLLFGLLALQNGIITRDALVAAFSVWQLNKGRMLDEILIEQNALSRERRAQLQQMLVWHVEIHGQDVAKSLGVISSASSACQALAGLGDADLQASLQHVAQNRPDAADPHATEAYSKQSSVTGSQRFHALRPHARGGLGEVSVALDSELNREVALKEIQPRYADDQRSRERFVLEAEITGGLEHPGIVPVYGLGVYSDGRPFYAMRFIKGDSLKDALQEFHKPAVTKKTADGDRQLQLRKLLSRFIDVCNAIEYAHSRGVLHRDLKPGNIMLGKYGETLVVDWGLAKTFGTYDHIANEARFQPASPLSGSGVTQAGSVIGTPAYMSPEQAAGRVDLIGPACDVYSLGATLYHILTGHLPIEEQDVGLVLQRAQKGDILRPRQYDSSIPRSLEAICLKAMALKPEDRYPNPRSLAEDLECWLADTPVSAWQETLLDRLTRLARRNRAWVLAGVVSLILIASVSVVAGLIVEGKRQEAHNAAINEGIAKKAALEAAESERGANEAAQQAKFEAKSQADDYRRRLSRHYVKSGELAIEGQDLSLALLWFVKALEVDLGDALREPRHRLRIALTRQQMPHLIKLLSHKGPISDLELSHNGKYLLTASYDGTARIWELATGQSVGKPLQHKGHVYQARFSPDDKTIATGSGDGTARIWDAATGEPTSAPLRHALSVGFIGFSPDGTRLATSCDTPGHYFPPPPGGDLTTDIKARENEPAGGIWDVSSGKLLTAIPGNDSNSGGPVAWSPNGETLVRTKPGIRFFDAATGKESRSMLLNERTITALTYVGDRYLVAKDHQAAFDVWDLKTNHRVIAGKYLDAVSGNFCIQDLSITEDRWLTAGRETWDLTTGKLSELTGEKSTIGALRSADRRYLLQIQQSGSFRIYSAQDGKAVSPAFAQMKVHGLPVRISPDRRVVAFVDSVDKAAVELWDLAGQGSRLPTPDSQHLTINSKAFFGYHRKRQNTQRGAASLLIQQDGQRVERRLIHGAPEDRVTLTSGIVDPHKRQVATAGDDMRIRFWDATTGRPRQPAIHVDGYPSDIRFSKDGKLILGIMRRANSELGYIMAWRTAERMPVWGPIEAGYRASQLQLSPTGRFFSWQTGEGAVQLRETETGRLVSGPLNHAYWSGLPQFNPDENQMVVPCGDSTATLWTIPKGEKKKVLEGSTQLMSAAFSHSGKLVASIGINEARVWDVVTGKLQNAAIPLDGWYGNSLVFSADDRSLAVTTANSSAASLWDVDTGERLGAPFFQPGNLSVTFSPDGKNFETFGEFAQSWSFEPDHSNLQELGAFAVAASGRDLDSTGKISPVSVSQRIRAWEMYQNGKLPGRQSCTAAQIRSWRLQQLHQLLNWNQIKVLPLEAPAILDQLVAENPDDSEILGLALVYAKTGMHSKAVDCLVKRILTVPAVPEEWRLLNACLEKTRGAQRVAEVAESALRAAPQHEAAWTLKGVAMLHLKKFDDAVEALTKAIELGATGQAFAFRGTAHAIKQKWGEAEADFVRILADEPNDLPSLRGLLAVKLATGNVDGWIQTADELFLRHGESHYGGPVMASEVARASSSISRHPQRIVDSMSASIARSPDDLTCRIAYGVAAYRHDQFVLAIEILSKPEIGSDAWQLLFLAMAHHHNNNPEAAKDHYGKAIKLIENEGSDRSWMRWYERIEVEHVRKEAAKLLGI